MAWINLGRVLDKKKWSMSEFARQLDIPYQNLSRVFKPGFDPKISTVLRWCEVLDCKPDDLYDESLSSEKKHTPKPASAAAFIKAMGTMGNIKWTKKTAMAALKNYTNRKILHDTNPTLFFYLLSKHNKIFDEILPPKKRIYEIE